MENVNFMLNFPKNRSIFSMHSTGMPQMATTLNGWEVPLELIRITQDVVEGDLQTTETKIQFKGVWQPLKMEQLELKPEGQRSWEWIWIHAKSSALDLKTADKVIFNNKRFKVMDKKDYGLNGFVEYELCRDYEETGTISDENASNSVG